MIIVNQRTNNENAYILTMGTEHSQNFQVFAKHEDEAIELLAEYLIAQNNSDSYFDALEINIMASSRCLDMQEFADAYDLYYCPKYHIYLPDLKVSMI